MSISNEGSNRYSESIANVFTKLPNPPASKWDRASSPKRVERKLEDRTSVVKEDVPAKRQSDDSRPTFEMATYRKGDADKFGVSSTSFSPRSSPYRTPPPRDPSLRGAPQDPSRRRGKKREANKFDKRAFERDEEDEVVPEPVYELEGVFDAESETQIPLAERTEWEAIITQEAKSHMGVAAEMIDESVSSSGVHADAQRYTFQARDLGLLLNQPAPLPHELSPSFHPKPVLEVARYTAKPTPSIHHQALQIQGSRSAFGFSSIRSESLVNHTSANTSTPSSESSSSGAIAARKTFAASRVDPEAVNVRLATLPGIVRLHRESQGGDYSNLMLPRAKPTSDALRNTKVTVIQNGSMDARDRSVAWGVVKRFDALSSTSQPASSPSSS